jgi:pimeloyl-ACP methyl ester carboxylesterase
MTSLYLHWGPGAHADIEREFFRDREEYSALDLWNQPNLNHLSTPLQSLRASVKEKVCRLLETNQRIRLVGHSFGAWLAMDILKDSAIDLSRIHSVVLMGAGLNLGEGYARLGRKVGHSSPADVFTNSHYQSSAFPSLIGAIAQTPNFQDHYWGASVSSQRAKTNYEKISQTAKPLDLEFYLGAMTDFFQLETVYDFTRIIHENLPISIHLGEMDPFLHVEEDARLWQEAIPHAFVKRHAAGHFLPFELEPTAWLV